MFPWGKAWSGEAGSNGDLVGSWPPVSLRCHGNEQGPDGACVCSAGVPPPPRPFWPARLAHARQEGKEPVEYCPREKGPRLRPAHLRTRKTRAGLGLSLQSFADSLLPECTRAWFLSRCFVGGRDCRACVNAGFAASIDPRCVGSLKLLLIVNAKAHEGRQITGSFLGFAVITGPNGSARGLCYQGADVRLHQIPRCQPFVWTAELKKADLELGKGEGTRGFWPCQSHLAENPGLYAEIS
ncbi:uncharacterized protein [Petaurus breviceps papuanus]|uniref:uncharacterized protein n=1 Tax=Petaurus breviceps papuanus TaxID=3040969 RepID=UPI0036DF2C92